VTTSESQYPVWQLIESRISGESFWLTILYTI
jgi:hypothetical protein